MPQKIRQLKAALLKVAFAVRPGKGSHTVWTHPALPEDELTLSDKDGDDAKPYQEKDVRKILEHLKRS